MCVPAVKQIGYISTHTNVWALFSIAPLVYI